MPGLGLHLPDLAARRRDPSGVPTPSSSPTPAPTPAIDRIMIEGDSITFAGGSDNGGFAWRYAANVPAGKTVIVHAQNSRTVGGASYAGPPVEGEDGGSPAGNTLLLHRPDDISASPQVILTMIGTNDLQTFSVANYRARLIVWANGLRAAGIKVGWSPPLPLNSGRQYAGYAAFMAKRAALMGDARDPAVWGQWADYYCPLGEQPDMNAADNGAYFSEDGVHPSDAGQNALFPVIAAIGDTIFDTTRSGSTRIDGARWPTSETNLATSTAIVRRFVVAGLDPAGTALGASVSGGGAQLRLNGGAYGSTVGTGSGDGHRLYNGDTIDLRLTTSAGNATTVAVDLRIGSETRTLTFTTVAMVTPATYDHGGVITLLGEDATHTYPGVAFAQPGTAVLAIASGAGAAPTAVTVGGVAAVRRRAMSQDAAISLWTVPISASGSRDVVATFAGWKGQSVLSWGVVRNADSTPVQIAPTTDGGGAGYASAPFLTDGMTVPASGIAIAWFGEYGGASITPATVNGDTLRVGEGNVTYQGETVGLCVGTRTTSGPASFGFAFGNWCRPAIVFKAAGT
jgi:lysophospholipase L1-like esterase